MKTGSIIAIFALLGFAVGCNRSDTERSSADVREPTPQVSRATIQDTNNLSPASRNTDSPTRVYPDATNSGAREPDNTGVNARDRSDNTLTPGDQGTSDSDREITRNIRRELMKNGQLSTTAKNIKIITVNGKVTLRGPVTNDQERQAIADAAQKVTGITGLDNQLEVKTN